MLQITNHIKPIRKEICPACRVNNNTVTFKAQLTMDEFIKLETKKSISIIDKIKDFFNLPKALRKNPELKELAQNAINGDGQAGKKLLNSDKLKGYQLVEVKEYVVNKLLANLIKSPTPAKAKAVVEMELVPELTKDMVHAKGRIKSLDELPTGAKGLGWVQVISAMEKILGRNKKVLEIIKEDSNPLASIAKEEYLTALKDFLTTVDKDQKRNNTSNYAKMYAMNLMVESGKTANEAYFLIDKIILSDKTTNMVKLEAVKVLPDAIAKANLPPLDKANLESTVIQQLKAVIKENSGNKDLQLACYKAIDAINN